MAFNPQQPNPGFDLHSKFSRGGWWQKIRLLSWRSRCHHYSVVWGKMKHLCHNDLHFKYWGVIRCYASAIIKPKQRLTFGLRAEFGSADSRRSSCSLIHVRLLNRGGVSEAWTSVEVGSRDWETTASTGLCLVCESVCGSVWDPGEIISSDCWVEYSILTL